MQVHLDGWYEVSTRSAGDNHFYADVKCAAGLHSLTLAVRRDRHSSDGLLCPQVADAHRLRVESYER